MVDTADRFDLGLQGRRILVVGAAQGLGRATAVWLAGLGARVILADVKDCSDAVAEAGNGATALTVDLTDRDSIEGLVVDVIAEGPLWGLVNCAGLLMRRPLAETTQGEIEIQIAVNQTGAFFLARAVMDAMQKQGGGGRIVLYSSQGGFTGGFYGSIPYAMTKAGITALVKSLARVGAADGITVNAISPGGIDTDMFRGGMSQTDIENFQKLVPMNRIGTPDETAAPTVFLLSNWAAFITGTTIHVTGGQYMP
jgi:NAD(P)-dependent dehydrogenase (short-subunit alcohol dehydrogenase family)